MRRGWAHRAASTGCEDWNSSLPAPGGCCSRELGHQSHSRFPGDTTGAFLSKGISDAARGPASKC